METEGGGHYWPQYCTRMPILLTSVRLYTSHRSAFLVAIVNPLDGGGGPGLGSTANRLELVTYQNKILYP